MISGQVILDTNVVSYLMRGGPLAEAYLPHIQQKLIAITFITVGEMYFGAEKAGWGQNKREQLEAALRTYVVIPYHHQIARCYGYLVAERQNVGRPIASNDAWIAACAVAYAVPLITHNANDFIGITGLTVITESK